MSLFRIRDLQGSDYEAAYTLTVGEGYSIGMSLVSPLLPLLSVGLGLGSFGVSGVGRTRCTARVRDLQWSSYEVEYTEAEYTLTVGGAYSIGISFASPFFHS